MTIKPGTVVNWVDLENEETQLAMCQGVVCTTSQEGARLFIKLEHPSTIRGSRYVIVDAGLAVPAKCQSQPAV